jgi:dephospho-CoA kinase
MEAMRSEWKRELENHPEAVIIFDIPLLFEGGFSKDFDIVILVYSTPAIQIQRLVERDKLSSPEAERTLSMQLPIESKRARSDYIIENIGEMESTLGQADEIWKRLRTSEE